MGTNYYWHEKDPTCSHCNRGSISDGLHIGKRSGGWTFSWRGYEPDHRRELPQGIRSSKEWVDFIRSHEGAVYNEYGELIPKEEFIAMALDWSGPDMRRHDSLPYCRVTVDEDGHDILWSEFS